MDDHDLIIEAPTRQQRRYLEHQRVKEEQRASARKPKRRLQKEDPNAHLRPLAQAMLMTGERSQKPTGRAISKMVRYLLASPLHQFSRRHQRGSWRSWPKNMGGAVG